MGRVYGAVKFWGSERRVCGRKQGLLFLKKKKQKDFLIPFDRGRGTARGSIKQEFFWFFFCKKRTSFFTLPMA
jgi:hypothetical protein